MNGRIMEYLRCRVLGRSLEYLTSGKARRSFPRGHGQRAVQLFPDHGTGFEILAAVCHFDLQAVVQSGDHLALRFQDFDEPERFPCGLGLGFDGKFRDLAHLVVDFCRGISTGEGWLGGFRGVPAFQHRALRSHGKSLQMPEQSLPLVVRDFKCLEQALDDDTQCHARDCIADCISCTTSKKRTHL